MLSTYCQQCGSKNEYRFQKPKFCSSCGAPLTIGSEETKEKPKEKNKASRIKADRIASDFDEEGTEVYEVPDINGLEYEIETTNSSFSLGSLFSNNNFEANPAPKKKKRGRPRKNG
jgi:uncharacterized Zn finger protein (UPF0148 family)